MRKTITSEILVAYSQCPRKAFLMMCTETHGTPHEYIKILEQRRQNNQRKYLDILLKKHLDVQTYNQDALKGNSGFLINASLEVNGLAADCAILTKVKTHSTLDQYCYEPTIFVGTYNIEKEQKLELFFVAHVLQQIQNKHPASGKIIGLDENSHNVNLKNSTKTLILLIERLQEWALASSPALPPLILNKHCSICQFQSSCRAKAEQEDNLSLLNGISTPKAINKYEKKGIFTVKQLSYTFKPRKRKKRTKNPPPATHKPELQALAIRERKIYLQEIPQLTRQPIEFFLDIEGIPDQQFYYLVGLLICEENVSTHYSFWADTPQDEALIWQHFLEKINQYPNAPIYHYGSYELRAIVRLAKRYDTDEKSLKSRLINVNQLIYGKVYFPTYSNHLKEIGTFTGATWSAPNASGLQTLVWRHYWDKTQRTQFHTLLVNYNKEDCLALKLLTDELSRIKLSSAILTEVDFANHPKSPATQIGQETRSQFEAILKFASVKYEKRKIIFQVQDKGKGTKRGGARPAKIIPKPTKVINVPPIEICPKCGGSVKPTNQEISRVITDLVLAKNGLKKTITKYVGLQGYCPKCMRKYSPPDILKYNSRQFYGHCFKAWIIYQRVALRISFPSIIESAEEHFCEHITYSRIPYFMKNLADYYAPTEELILRHLLESPFIHADETDFNIQGVNWYVWVFTNGKYVIFKLTETRETDIVHKILNGYDGVLVSDFYSGYDSVKCKHQKCWVHLIRHLNSDLRENPFDIEYEMFILEVRKLIVPIMETLQRYGLRRRHLNIFKEEVDKFYKNMIDEKRYKSEVALKYQQRFARYRSSLFTFLEDDGIPWHNNTAENAIRHVALQRDKSQSPFHEAPTHDYLRLLSIRQTCRFQNQSFFRFLFSGETNLDNFRA